jgi:hypothetical protein
LNEPLAKPESAGDSLTMICVFRDDLTHPTSGKIISASVTIIKAATSEKLQQTISFPTSILWLDSHKMKTRHRLTEKSVNPATAGRSGDS